jgi:AraC-like DNA-binding protein
MQAIPLARSGSVRPLLDFVEKLGARPGPALANARPLLLDPTAMVPMPMGGALFEEAQRTVGDTAFGLRAGASVHVLEFNDWGSVMRQARTIAGLLATIGIAARRFNTGQQFWTFQRGEDVWLHWRFTSRLTDGRRGANEFALAIVLQALRLAGDDAWRPDEIHLEGAPPRHAEELAALARQRVFFDQPHAAVVFPARDLTRAYPLLAQRAADHSGSVPADDFAGSVRQLAASLLKAGALDLAVAAESARMSERSLQRRLAACGLSFARIADDVRFEAARRMLGEPGRKIVEVSADLGYTDSANFTRAFRRWAGISPQAFRQSA